MNSPMHHVFFHFSLIVSRVSALPIYRTPNPSSDRFSCIAALLTFSSIMTLLYTTRFLFRKSRQIWFSRLGTPSRLDDTFHVSSKLGQSKSGLLIGLLGSPTWEIGFTLTLHKRIQEQQQSFFAPESILYASCRRYQDSQIEISSSSRERTFYGQSLNYTSASSDLRKQYEKTCDKLALQVPVLTQQAICGDESLLQYKTILPRCRSLPSVRIHVQPIRLRRSYSSSSQISEVITVPDISALYVLPCNSLRLVDCDTQRENPLPLSPPPRQTVTTPSFQAISEPATETLPKSLEAHRKPKYGHDNNTASNYSIGPEKLFRSYTSMPTQAFQQPEDIDITEENSQNTLVVDQSQPLQHFSTPERTAPPYLERLTCTPLSPVIMFKLKPYHRHPSFRSRRSPPIGPSPLRSMILPETMPSSISDLDSSGDLSEERSKSLKVIPLDQNTNSQSQGERNIWENPSAGEDTDVLFDLIQELVEETNAWDESLFVDKNFKSMIQGSQVGKTTEKLPQRHRP
ncbi:hypothetical protein AMATHDRAFT_45970 [Amanita thiersii Skay4041]|uniref:Uncharacterized protein n=1 Tax=Amanita thiersii Skay4041 TaxID=703135 RepID=A0A2A9NY23_9AGAR|nr:hypothetical protein AMATHDRAFT_45970 [Amanita thiersii Skay4041]